MFNPQLASNYSSNAKQQQGYQQNQSSQYNTQNIGYNQGGSGQYSGQANQQYDSQVRNSQLNVSNMDQNYKLSNMLQKNQNSKLNNSYTQSTYHDRKVLNQNLQQMLSQNNQHKQNNSQINAQTYKETINLNNTISQGNQLNQTMNTTFRKEQIQLELRDQKTFAYCSRWIHIGLVCVYSIAAVVVSSVLVYYFPDDSSYRKEMGLTIDNWNQDMYEDVEVIQLTTEDKNNKSTPRCSANYENLFTIYGLEIVDGCNCKASTFDDKTIIPEVCSTSQKSKGCVDISGISSPVGFNWETPDGSNIFTICVKKIKGLTYSKYGITTNCDKTCGGNTEDTKICVDSTQACPINYLYFAQTADPSKTITDLKERSIGGYKLFYSNKGPGAPIVDIRITKGVGVCLENNVQNLYPKITPHPLLNTNKTNTCDTTSTLDNRFTKLLTLNEKRLYQINYFDNVYTAITDYTLSDTETYSVYSRPVITIAGDRRDADISKFEESDSDYYKVDEASVSVLVTSVIYLVFVGIVYSVCSVLNILSKKYLFKQYLFDLNPIQEQSSSSIFKRLWLKMISLLVAFIITLQNYIVIKNLASGKLGDAYTNKLVSNLKTEYYDKILWFIVSNFIYFAFLIILELFVLVPLCSKKLKEDTKVKISRKYMAKPGSSLAQHQQMPNSNNNRTFELPEYQTHNIYAGNGINTTINPFVQQMSVLGVDITTAHNRSVHMGPGIYPIPSRNQQGGGGPTRQTTYNLNNSTINQSILPPEIKNYESGVYNKTQQYGEYRAPATNQMTSNPTEQQEIYKKSPHQNQQYNSSTNRGIDNITAGSQSALPTAPNQSELNKNVYNNNRNNERNNERNQEQQRPNVQSIFFSNNNDLKNPSPIQYQSNYHSNEKNNQFQFGDDNHSQTIDLDFQSNQIVYQQPAGASHFNDDNISHDFGMQSSIAGDYRKNKVKYSIDTLPNQVSNNRQNEFGQIQPIPEVDSYRQQFGQERQSNYASNNKEIPSQNNYNNTIKSTGKLDSQNRYQQQYNSSSQNQVPTSTQQYISNNGSGSNINRNIIEDDNNYSNTMNELGNENKLQKIKNTGFNANQQHQQQPQQFESYSSSFRDTGNRNNSNNQRKNNQNPNQYNIYDNNNNNPNNNNNYYNPQQNQQIYQAQNRIYDKNDQDVDDPDMYDINLPSYNQKFY